MRLTTLLSIYSILIVSGCAAGPARPDTNISQIIVTKDLKEAYGYNMQTDYDSDGVLKPDAQAKIIILQGLIDLKGWYCTDPKGFKNLKIYLGNVRNYAKEHCR